MERVRLSFRTTCRSCCLLGLVEFRESAKVDAHRRIQYMREESSQPRKEKHMSSLVEAASRLRQTNLYCLFSTVSILNDQTYLGLVKHTCTVVHVSFTNRHLALQVPSLFGIP